MQIRSWGARGSIAVSGPEYVRYGGDTTCMEIRSADGEVVVVDAGTGMRKLGIELLAEQHFAISLFFTHAHWDHLMGFPFFKPLYQKGSNIEVFGSGFAQRSVRNMVTDMMSPPYFPVHIEDVSSELTFHGESMEPVTLGSMQVLPIVLSHPNGGVGYKFVEGDSAFVFLTDNELGHQHRSGLSFDEYVAYCEGADLLIHDAEYTPQEYEHTRTWGHSSYVDVIELAVRAGVRRLGLYHHHPERIDADIDAMVADCRSLLSARGSDIECFAITQDHAFEA